MVTEDNTHKNVSSVHHLILFPSAAASFSPSSSPKLPAPILQPQDQSLVIIFCYFYMIVRSSHCLSSLSLMEKSPVPRGPLLPAQWLHPLALFLVDLTERNRGLMWPMAEFWRPQKTVLSCLDLQPPQFLTSDHRHAVLDVHVVGVTALVHFAGAGISQDETAHSSSK